MSADQAGPWGAPARVHPTDLVRELFGPAGRRAPYPIHAALHEHGPVIEVAANMLVVCGYDLARDVLRDNAFLVEDGPYWDTAVPGWRAHPALATLQTAMLFTNDPAHGALREAMRREFTPARITGLREAIGHRVEHLVDRLAEHEAVEFVEEFATRLPMSVICELIGVPAEDGEALRPYASALSTALEPGWPALDLTAADAAATELCGYFAELLATRRRRPADDLVSRLAAGRLAAPDLVANLVLMLFAGFETTANLLSNGLAVLLRRTPRERAAGAGFVEEVLRCESPVQLTSRRTESVTVLGDRLVRPGSVAVVLIGAANRDPRRFADPDRFDADRRDSQPLSFGFGAHYCLGAPLARLEAGLAFPLLLKAFPDMVLAGAPVRHERTNLRGYARLPISVR